MTEAGSRPAPFVVRTSRCGLAEPRPPHDQRVAFGMMNWTNYCTRSLLYAGKLSASRPQLTLKSEGPPTRADPAFILAGASGVPTGVRLADPND